MDWEYISASQKLSEPFIEKHADKVEWYWISKKQKLSESFIEKHADKVDWFLISIYQTLSEPFIEKHVGELDWSKISKYQTLSESFIEKHKDKVDWLFISKYQKLSEDFCNKHNIITYTLNVVHRCGFSRRSIFIYKDRPKIIHIGCFKGTKDEAIEAIKSKYYLDEDAMNEYIAKVEECFNY